MTDVEENKDEEEEMEEFMDDENIDDEEIDEEEDAVIKKKLKTIGKSKIIKIAILGDGGTGKTSLLRAKCKEDFEIGSEMTIGVDIACIPINMEKFKEEKASFLAIDLGGQRRFHFIHDAYIHGIKFAVVLYDLTRYQTFANISHWMTLLADENPEIPILLVGNKIDLADEGLKSGFISDWNDNKKYIKNSEFVIDHIFISARKSLGLDELFEKIEEITCK